MIIGKREDGVDSKDMFRRITIAPDTDKTIAPNTTRSKKPTFEKIPFELFKQEFNNIGIMPYRYDDYSDTKFMLGKYIKDKTNINSKDLNSLLKCCYDSITCPSLKTRGALGFDIADKEIISRILTILGDVRDNGFMMFHIPTGIKVSNFSGFMIPKSRLGSSADFSITLRNTIGVIDPDYNEELFESIDITLLGCDLIDVVDEICSDNLMQLVPIRRDASLYDVQYLNSKPTNEFVERCAK